MRTAEREGGAPAAAPLGAPAEPRVRHTLATLAGPALIVASVLVALRGFAFANLLSNQHSDILSFWLPRSCLMGRSLAAGDVPLWNPFEMAGTPFAADSQSGWLALPTMLLSWLFGCGGGLRALIVLHPIMAGLGTYWFLRRERLGRVPATAGGLSFAMTMAASTVAISMPFAGFLAWTPFVLVGASGYLTKADPPHAIVDGIRGVNEGGTCFSPAVLDRMVIDRDGARLATGNRSRLGLLTDREREVLSYVAKGLSQREIARLAGISVKTVQHHITSVMDKLQIHDRVELAHFAIREGVVEA